MNGEKFSLHLDFLPDATYIVYGSESGAEPLYSRKRERAGTWGEAETAHPISALYLVMGAAAGGKLQMNRPRNTKQRTRDMVLLAMFTAILFILAFTPIGLIDLPLIKATILHVPVIVGAILLGPRKGAFLGFMFGLTSLIKNTLAPSALSFAFSPLIPVPGMDRGSLWALVVCFVPRIFVGVTPWLIYRAVTALTKNRAVRTGAMAVAGVVGAFTNTILVMGMIYLVFREAYATMGSIPVDAVLGVILGIVGTNGVPEAIVAAVITPAVCLPLIKALKLEAVSTNLAD